MGIAEKILGVMYKITQKRRERYRARLAKKNKNKSPTIIANDCLGGMIYHTLGLKFNSPTINLAIPRADFLTMCQDLRGFFSANVKEVLGHDKNFPVGELSNGLKTIQIYFMHYKTFEEAKKKWDSRKERIDYDNIFIIQTMATNLKEEEVRAFDELPYENKMLISSDNRYGGKNIVVNKAFQTENYTNGCILQYKNKWAKKRYMDDIDYVGFLNKK